MILKSFLTKIAVMNMTVCNSKLLSVLIYTFFVQNLSANEGTCDSKSSCDSTVSNKYTKEANQWQTDLEIKILNALSTHAPCDNTKCGCHKNVIDDDLKPFSKTGITKNMLDEAKRKGTKYQIINHRLYRDKECHFPARCSGVDHYLKLLLNKLNDTELIINTRDWPQIWKSHDRKIPVFSFSKSSDYLDIMYPAWSFWEGGPAISLYPSGLGKWEEHRTSITEAVDDKYSWEKKENKGFFRGSRTSEERDALILLSRAKPDLIDAQYTKNQAWKSEKDTLNLPPAPEVSLEDHCRYKYLFNFRGVAASFRFKHLFLCRSLVFHVGNDWLEFFYPSLKPWVHYIPIDSKASQKDIERYIQFFKTHDEIANEISERGFRHIWNNLSDQDVKCYWRKLLQKYTKLLKFDVQRDLELFDIK